MTILSMYKSRLACVFVLVFTTCSLPIEIQGNDDWLLFRAGRLLDADDAEESLRVIAHLTEKRKTTPEVRFLRARALDHVGKHVEAQTLFNLLCEEYPRDPRYLGGRGVSYFTTGAIESGLKDLTTAIDVYAPDTQRDYYVHEQRELQKESMLHGREQVSRLISSRSCLKTLLTEHDNLKDWLVCEFAGRRAGVLAEWDEREPLTNEAEHDLATSGRPALIRVGTKHKSGNKKDKDKDAEEVLAQIVFELFNVGNGEGAVELRQKVVSGTISRKEFVKQSVSLEARAAQFTRFFYVKEYVSFVDNKLRTTPYIWYFHQWSSVDDIVNDTLNDPRKYPWEPFGREFDWLRINALSKTGHHDDAIGIARQMCAYTEGSTQERAFLTLYDNCVRAGRHIEALDAATDGLQRHPDSVELLVRRAYCRMQFLDDIKGAQTDVDVALRLQSGHKYAEQLREVLREAERTH